MQNDRNEIVDLYIPRKCSASNKLITAYDHSAVQISVKDVSIILLTSRSMRTAKS